jgi:hypothetical protein
MSNSVSRINQYEAEVFDDYMINLIYDTVKNSFETSELSTLRRFSEEIKLFLKIFYYSFKLFKDKVTEGQKIYNIKFEYGEGIGAKLKIFKIVGYLTCKLLVPYILNKIEDLSISHNIQLEEDASEKKSYPNLKFFLFALSKILNFLLKLFDLINYLGFLLTNDYPTIWHRLFNIKYSMYNPEKTSQLSFNYLMKKIVWSQFAKIILFFFNFTIGKKGLQSIFNQLISIAEESQENILHQTMNKCFICRDYLTNLTKLEKCEHVFCYFCITLHKENSDMCPVCYIKI